MAGATALHYAAAEGTQQTLNQLIEAGANLEITTKKGRTVLHYAAINETETEENTQALTGTKKIRY